jgi:hypothetical protein
MRFLSHKVSWLCCEIRLRKNIFNMINLGEIQSHLQGMVNLIRDEDTMRLVSQSAGQSSGPASN